MKLNIFVVIHLITVTFNFILFKAKHDISLNKLILKKNESSQQNKMKYLTYLFGLS